MSSILGSEIADARDHSEKQQYQVYLCTIVGDTTVVTSFVGSTMHSALKRIQLVRFVTRLPRKRFGFGFWWAQGDIQSFSRHNRKTCGITR